VREPPPDKGAQYPDSLLEKSLHRFPVDILHPIDEATTPYGTEQQALCLYRSVPRQNHVRAEIPDSTCQQLAVLTFLKETPNEGGLLNRPLQGYRLNLQSTGVIRTLLHLAARTREGGRIQMQDLVASARHFTTQLHLKWVPNVVVNHQAVYTSHAIGIAVAPSASLGTLLGADDLVSPACGDTTPFNALLLPLVAPEPTLDAASEKALSGFHEQRAAKHDVRAGAMTGST
jgi:hypothetical protein